MVLHSAGDNYVPLADFPTNPPDNDSKRTPADSNVDSLWNKSDKTPKGGKKNEDYDFFDDDDEELESYTTSGDTDSGYDSDDSGSDSSDGDDGTSSDDEDTESESEDANDSVSDSSED